MLSLSGALIILNKRCIGTTLLLISVAFILATKDNLYLHSNQVSTLKERNLKISDIIKMLSTVGCALLLMMDNGTPKKIYIEKSKQ